MKPEQVLEDMIDPEQVLWIINNVSSKKEFIGGLIRLLGKVSARKDKSELQEYIDSWEATAELNTIPGTKENSWKAYKALRARKLI